MLKEHNANKNFDCNIVFKFIAFSDGGEVSLIYKHLRIW